MLHIISSLILLFWGLSIIWFLGLRQCEESHHHPDQLFLTKQEHRTADHAKHPSGSCALRCDNANSFLVPTTTLTLVLEKVIRAIQIDIAVVGVVGARREPCPGEWLWDESKGDRRLGRGLGIHQFEQFSARSSFLAEDQPCRFLSVCF
ncbi:uncharacterized protein BJX67DRAFT_310825 [Aspergillus lucknowensis]|uniref:Secreted protein n=1 Tax=Aspergillus lucknowensis TaxID=176173 RepID=A0ABR4LCH2_9EURO